MKDAFDIVKKYANEHGYDTVRPAGAKSGFSYFHAFNQSSIGHKTGLPHIIKINEAGQLSVVKNLKERMWAVKEEVKLL
ncbi:MAG: hypothetical protein ACI36X_05530 [Bacteroidaceae bacterium]